MRVGRPALTVFACLVCGSASAQPAKQAEAPKFDPEAQRILRDMSEFLSRQKAFEVEVDSTTDVVRDDGQKVEMNNESKVSVERPDKVRILRSGDRPAQLFYDGRTFTVSLREPNVYAQEKAPPPIDQTVVEVQDKLGVDIGAGDLLMSDPARTLTEDSVSGRYLGRSLIDGVPTHHLAFRGKTVDWELWVEQGDRPLPRRYVITTKDVPAAPQHSVTLSNWQLLSDLPDAKFVFEPPKDARKIDFVVPHAVKKGQEKK